jgi:hypothetical protein
MYRNLTALFLLALPACSPPSRGENSAICGITMLAAGARIMDQITLPNMALTEPPEALHQGIVPVRVVGYGTTPAVTGLADDGRVTVTYLGEGFPSRPGFGAALVDDSSEVFRGILIWDKEPPPDDYPRIGTITNTSTTMPLIAVSVNWPSVNSDRCPLFAELDSIAQ